MENDGKVANGFLLFKRQRLFGSRVIYLSRMEYNSDNGLADELLKQTNASRIELLARNGILVFFLSLNAQELTRFPLLPLFLFLCLRGTRYSPNESQVHADCL